MVKIDLEILIFPWPIKKNTLSPYTKQAKVKNPQYSRAHTPSKQKIPCWGVWATVVKRVNLGFLGLGVVVRKKPMTQLHPCHLGHPAHPDIHRSKKVHPDSPILYRK